MQKRMVKIAALVALASIALASDAPIRAVKLSGGVWVDLGAGLPSRAMAVNNTTAVGTTAANRAFAYNGSLTELSNLRSEAAGINASSQVTGTSVIRIPDGCGTGCDTYTSPHAFLFDGSLIDLDPSNPTVASYGFGVSDGGTVVGEYAASVWPHGRAFSYDGSWHDLGTLGTWSSASAISPNGSIIVGVSQTDPGIVGGIHVFTYSGSGPMTDLGRPSWGCYNGGRMQVNNSGQIAGWDCSRGYYYDSGSFHLVPLLSGDSVNNATALNASGQIVGYGWPSLHPYKFEISGAVLTDLGVAKAGGGSWDWVYPMSINASGDVVGWAR